MVPHTLTCGLTVPTCMPCRWSGVICTPTVGALLTSLPLITADATGYKYNSSHA